MIREYHRIVCGAKSIKECSFRIGKFLMSTNDDSDTPFRKLRKNVLRHDAANHPCLWQLLYRIIPAISSFHIEMYRATTTMTQARAAAMADRTKLSLMPPRVASLANRPEMDPFLVL